MRARIRRFQDRRPPITPVEAKRLAAFAKRVEDELRKLPPRSPPRPVAPAAPPVHAGTTRPDPGKRKELAKQAGVAADRAFADLQAATDPAARRRALEALAAAADAMDQALGCGETATRELCMATFDAWAREPHRAASGPAGAGPAGRDEIRHATLTRNLERLLAACRAAGKGGDVLRLKILRTGSEVFRRDEPVQALALLAEALALARTIPREDERQAHLAGLHRIEAEAHLAAGKASPAGKGATHWAEAEKAARAGLVALVALEGVAPAVAGRLLSTKVLLEDARAAAQGARR